eukprot:1977657-Rhodomonas_salina.3
MVGEMSPNLDGHEADCCENRARPGVENDMFSILSNRYGREFKGRRGPPKTGQQGDPASTSMQTLQKNPAMDFAGQTSRTKLKNVFSCRFYRQEHQNGQAREITDDEQESRLHRPHIPWHAAWHVHRTYERRDGIHVFEIRGQVSCPTTDAVV